MLRVLYDYQIFSMQVFGGISRYYYELAKRVANAKGFSASVAAPFHINEYVVHGGVRVRGTKIPNQPGTKPIFMALNAVLSPVSICASRPHVIHETYYYGIPIARRRCRTVVTVYDMIHEKFPEQFPPNSLASKAKRAAVRRADRVICISESTRKDLIEIIGVEPDKTKTIHLGTTIASSEAAIIPASPRPYLFYVGERGGYKNFSLLLEAYASSVSLVRQVDLVAFGGGAFTKVEHDQIRRLKLPPESVRQISGGDALLSALYRRALAFVCPSLYEGFGIPLLEAMSLDCPVVCSNTSSIPEVAADAAYFFDPKDLDSIRTSVESVVGSERLRRDMIERGRERVKHFSWDRCAEETMEIYRELAS